MEFMKDIVETVDLELLQSNIFRTYYLLQNQVQILRSKKMNKERFLNHVRLMLNFICLCIKEDKTRDEEIKFELIEKRAKVNRIDKNFSKNLSKLLTFDRVYTKTRIKTPLFKEDLYVTRRKIFFNSRGKKKKKDE